MSDNDALASDDQSDPGPKAESRPAPVPTTGRFVQKRTDMGLKAGANSSPSPARTLSKRSGGSSSASDQVGTKAASQKSTTATTTPSEDVPVKTRIDRIDSREKRFGYIAAVFSGFLGVFIYFIETDNKHFKIGKGQFTPQTTLIVGFVAAALLLGATYLGRRAPLGFVALLTGLSFGQSSLFFGFPFLILGGWLIYRSFKIQKEAATEAREARASAPPRGRTNPPNRSKPAGRSNGGSSTGPKGPQANKRFTPKRPAPPPPKPTRKERKEAAKE